MIERIYQAFVDTTPPLEYISDGHYSRILDVGCGNGRISEQLADIGETVVGLELDRDRLDVFQESGVPQNQEIVQGDATSLPFPDNHFDLVSSYTVYEHIPEEAIPNYLAEIHRVLQPDGTVYIVNDAFFYRVLRKSRLLMPERGPAPGHINMVTPNAMADEIEKAGFKIELVRYSPYHHFLDSEPSFLSPLATKGYVVATI